jgi:hypothetical protein
VERLVLGHESGVVEDLRDEARVEEMRIVLDSADTGRPASSADRLGLQKAFVPGVCVAQKYQDESTKVSIVSVS